MLTNGEEKEKEKNHKKRRKKAQKKRRKKPKEKEKGKKPKKKGEKIFKIEISLSFKKKNREFLLRNESENVNLQL